MYDLSISFRDIICTAILCFFSLYLKCYEFGVTLAYKLSATCKSLCYIAFVVGVSQVLTDWCPHWSSYNCLSKCPFHLMSIKIQQNPCSNHNGDNPMNVWLCRILIDRRVVSPQNTPDCPISKHCRWPGGVTRGHEISITHGLILVTKLTGSLFGYQPCCIIHQHSISDDNIMETLQVLHQKHALQWKHGTISACSLLSSGNTVLHQKYAHAKQIPLCSPLDIYPQLSLVLIGYFITDLSLFINLISSVLRTWI